MASRSLGTLTIDLLARTGLLEQGLDKAGRTTQKFARDVGKQADAVEAAFDKAFLAVGVAATAAFGAVSLAVKSSIDDMYDLVTRAKQVAMPIDQFSAYAGAADDAEVSIDSFSTALRKLDQSLAMAKQGSAQSASLFKALGIDPKTIQTTQQAFLAVSNSFAKYRDDANKVAIAQQLLGRSGTELIAFMNQGGDAIDKLAQHQRDLGVAFDQNGANKLSALDDAMDEFHGTVKGLSNTLALALVPTITEVTQKATEFISAWRDSGGLKKFTDALGTLIDNLGSIATFFVARFAVGKIIAGIAAVGDAAMVAGTLVGTLRVALGLLGGPIGIVSTALAGLLVVGKRWDDAQIQGKQSTDALRQSIEALNRATGDETRTALQNAVAKEDQARATLAAAQANLAELQSRQQLAQQQADDALKLSGGGSVFGQNAGLANATQRQANDAAAKARQQLNVVLGLQKTIRDAQAAIGEKVFATGPAAATNVNKPGIVLPGIGDGAKAKSTVDALASAYDALARSSASYANSLGANDPVQKATDAMAAGVENLAKLSAAYVKAGGDAKLADDLVAQGIAGLRDKYNFDLQQPKRELDAYTNSLRDQLDALKASQAVQIAGMTMGDHAARQAQELAQATQDATKAITDFVQAHQLHPEAMSEDMYQAELQALKDYYEQRRKLIEQNQAAENAIRGDMDAGWQKGIADFIEQTNDKFEQGRQLAESFTSGFSDAFSKFASGAESAKQAFASFVDDLFAQALRFTANQALAKLLELGKDRFGGGGSGILSTFAGFFGGGRASGGPVAAGGLYQVNENGPELLTVGNRQLLMMGPQGGTVQPMSRSRSTGNTTINVAVQPTSTRQSAFQTGRAVATALRDLQARA